MRKWGWNIRCEFHELFLISHWYWSNVLAFECLLVKSCHAVFFQSVKKSSTWVLEFPWNESLKFGGRGLSTVMSQLFKRAGKKMIFLFFFKSVPGITSEFLYISDLHLFTYLNFMYFATLSCKIAAGPKPGYSPPWFLMTLPQACMR